MTPATPEPSGAGWRGEASVKCIAGQTLVLWAAGTSGGLCLGVAVTTSFGIRQTCLVPGGTAVKYAPASAGDAGDTGSVPALGRSSGVGNGNPLHYSCLDNSTPGGAYGLQSAGSQRAGYD